MEDWDSSFWIDELAKIANNSAKKVDENLQEQLTRAKFGQLTDIGDPEEENNEEEQAAEESDGITVDLNYKEDESVKSYDIYSESANSKRYSDISFNQEDHPTSERRRRNYNTTHVHCTLTDMIIGSRSPTIRAAMQEIYDEIKQRDLRRTSRARSPRSSITSSSSPISFKSLIREQ